MSPVPPWLLLLACAPDPVDSLSARRHRDDTAARGDTPRDSGDPTDSADSGGDPADSDSQPSGLQPLHLGAAVGMLGDLADPAPGALIADGFGPRLIGGAGDFHPGLDLTGRRGLPIRAVSAGTVERISYADGTESNHIYVRHDLARPIPFHGQQVSAWYSLYGHLDRIDAREGQQLAAGEALGTMGDSGGADTVHLHLEIRLGTWCSLEYQTQTPGSSCVTGYDPAINPLHAIPGAIPGGLILTQISARTFLLTSTSPDLDAERISAVIGGDLRTVDLDLREGLDATSEAALDQLDLGWISIEPQDFAPGDLTRAWLLRLSGAPDRLEVSDISGEGWRWEP